MITHIKEMSSISGEGVSLELIKYYSTVLGVKNNFINVKNKSEILKIWARWIITCRTEHISNVPFYPPNGSHLYSQLVKELCDKNYPIILQDELHNIDFTIPSATLEFPGWHGKIPITIKQSHKRTGSTPPIYFISPYKNNDLGIHVHSVIFNKLLKLFTKTCNCMVQWNKYSIPYIWQCLLNYELLDGRGLQWAVPPNVMAIFAQMGCDCELFASPLNSYFKNYYSLFPIDRLFGSRGNFFSAYLKPGTYQVNPPFVDSIFTLTTIKILSYLSRKRNYTFIYVMPDWKDLSGYTMLANSPYLKLVCNLRPGDHYYYQYSTSTYIKATFKTKILILSNTPLHNINQLWSDIIIGFRP